MGDLKSFIFCLEHMAIEWFLDVPIPKHIRVCHMITLFSVIIIYFNFNLIIIVVRLPVSFNTSIVFCFFLWWEGGRCSEMM